ncbi:MAG TPA: hypothetical protein DHW14_08100 [Clostridiales bacterium]|nr:hypothetical protein [Clostridiales bacterium]
MAQMLIKADVVVGEDVAETAVDKTVYLEYPARVVTDVQARVTEVECEVQEDQVVVSGTVHKQIFYVGPEDRVYHQGEDVAFCAVATVPGAQPGMDCQVHPTVQAVEYRLVGCPPTTELKQRIILAFFVKVTRPQQLDVVLGTTGPLYKVQRVVCEESSGAVVESVVELSNPVEKVRTVRCVVSDYTTTCAEDQVIIEGVLHAQVFCISAFDQTEYLKSTDVPFTAVVPAKGAHPGQNVDADISVARVSWTLEGDELHQRAVLSIFVKVTETAQTMLCTDPCGPLIKVGRVAGENTKQVIVEDQVCLDVPAKKVQDILAFVTTLSHEVLDGKVVVQGTIHKQIFFVGPNDIVRHQSADIPFSAVVEVSGAEPNMAVQVHPTIEHVGWTLIKETPECPLPPYYDGPYGDVYRVIEQRVIVELFVKVTETVQINVRLNDGPPQG